MKLIFFLMCMSLCFCGCGNGLEKCVRESISEMREYILLGGDENVSCNLMCGTRECEYKLDGYHTESIEFGVITVRVLGDSDSVDSGTFLLFSGTQKYSGELIKNPFDDTLVADIKCKVDRNANNSVVVTIGGKNYSFKLRDVGSEWSFSIDDGIKKFVKDFKEEISTLIVDSELMGEMYVKILNDEMGESNDYYYLISIVGRYGESVRAIYSPITGDILASNCNIQLDG